MAKPLFTGSCPALITPFTKEGTIDYSMVSQLIELHIQEGASALCIAGTTGEGSTLSLREHIALISHCSREIAGRAILIAGAGKNDTSTAVYLSRKLEEVGADALLHVTPYYNKASQPGLIAHYEAIATAVSLPIILYNVPTRTGVSFTAETYYALSQIPNIIGVKEASGSHGLFLATRALCGEEFHIWSGNDDQVVSMMALGAKGVISVLANIAPKVVTEMTSLCERGEFEQAARLQIDHASLIGTLFSEVNPIPVKTAMEFQGYQVGGFRPPLCELDEKKKKLLKHNMEQVKLLCK